MLRALLLSTIAAGPELQVAVRAGEAPAAVCSVREAEGVAREGHLARTTAGEWRWQRVKGEVLACSSPGFEPMEIEADQPGLPPRIERALWPARTVTLAADGPGIDAVVEWRALSDTEAATTLIARQNVRLDARLELPVAYADRLIRVYPKDRSPMSLFVPAGTSPVTVPLPPRRAGGEIFGRLPAHAMVPVAVEVSADGASNAFVLKPDARRLFQASGLASGRYTFVPRYQGGLRGRAHTMVVRAGQTAELLPWALPEAGAASLAAAPEICVPQNLPARLWLQRVSAQGAVEPGPLADVSAPPCERELQGLEEGTYEASFRGAGGKETLGAARFLVRPGETVRVRLAMAEVRVNGRLTWGGDQPAPGFTLVFANDGQTWTAQSDDNGEYRTTLGPAGAYRVFVQARADLAETAFMRRFLAGDQTADFAIAVGAILVRAARDDAAPLQEEVHAAVISKAGRRTASWLPEEEREKRFSGLAPGEYWVTGRTGSGLVALTAARVVLSAEQPLAEVELALGRHDGLLEVVDEAGGPLASAQVEGRETLLTASGPGTFPLREVPMGEWLKVRAAGYLPACRIVQPGNLPSMRVVLRRALESVTLSLEPELAWDSGLWEIPGSDCPISMSDLEYEARPERSGTTVTVRLSRGRYQLVVGAVTRPVEVPGGEVRFGVPK